MNNKIKYIVIGFILLTTLIVGNVYASSILAKNISFNPTVENKYNGLDVDNVEDALNVLYKKTNIFETLVYKNPGNTTPGNTFMNFDESYGALGIECIDEDNKAEVVVKKGEKHCCSYPFVSGRHTYERTRFFELSKDGKTLYISNPFQILLTGNATSEHPDLPDILYINTIYAKQKN